MEVKITLTKHQVPCVALNAFAVSALLACAALTGCASSAVSREAANRVDTAYEASHELVSNGIADANPVDGFRNSSEIYQGAGLGGVTGAVIAGASTGTIGIIPGAIAGAVAGGVMGAFVERHSNQFDQIENRGGQVFVLGDQVMVALPSEQIFRGVTPVIQPRAYSTLNLVARLISGYHTLSVKVAANSYGDGTPEVEQSVSQEQADSVEKYLSRHADVRLIHAIGYGGTHLVDKQGAAANYRIEITLEKLPA